MVQVLPQFDPGAQFGKSFGSGLSEGLMSSNENTQLRNILEQLGPAADPSKMAQSVMGLNIRPEAKEQALRGLQAMSLLGQRQEAQQFKASEEAQKRQFELAEGPVIEKYLRGESLTPEDYQNLSPTTRRSLIQAQSQPETFEKESEKLQAQSSNKYYTDVLDSGKKARKQLTEVEIARDLNERGVTGLTARNKAADIFGEWIRDPNATEFRARSKQFMEGIKELIGGRITEFEFKYFQNMFPNLDQSMAANESLLGMVELREKSKIHESKVANQIVKENGGRIPPNLQAQVDEKMDKYMDKEVERWKQKSYRAMLKEDPPAKDEVAVIDDNGQYMFLPKSQLQAWKDSGRMVIGQ